MSTLSDALRTAGEQLQGQIDAETLISEFDRCLLANFLTDSATRAKELEGVVLGDLIFGRKPMPGPYHADLDEMQTILERLAGHYTLSDWAKYTNLIVKQLPALVRELREARDAERNEVNRG